jgi:hypothetical protein
MVLLGQHVELCSLGIISSWSPLYASPGTSIGPCILNVLSKFVSQREQKIKFLLLVKEYSPLPTHDPSVQFYWSPLETTQVNPWDECPSTFPPTSAPLSSGISQMRRCPFSPTAVGCSSQRGDLFGLGDQNTKWASTPSPMRTPWALHPVKGHAASQLMVPQECLKMPQGRKPGCFHKTVYMFLRDMLKDHSWLLPQQSVFLQRYVKRLLYLWLPAPLPIRKDQIKKTLCKQQRATDSPGSLSISKGSFSFLSNKSYFVCWPCCPQVSLLPHKPILWPVKTRTLNTAHNNILSHLRITQNSNFNAHK